ncbi:MAG TPA: fumarylacetoacetate hydrolase family protein [Chloroflexota bacterium]|jgi:2-keto-4-pentenoate hydratase/2-oxohepta-3-ene-1,7-dioic acid hydratase in catechol pathway
MKLATFRTREAPTGQFGALLENGRLLALRVAAMSLLGEYSLPDRVEASRLLRHAQAFLDGGEEAFALAYQVVQRAEQALREGRAPAGASGERLLFDEQRVEFLPPVPRPGKILAAGRNFREHAAEVGATPSGDRPAGFIKVTSALVGHEGAVIYPHFTRALDYEAEVAVVIGRACKNVPRERALEYVAGYAILNDLSARDVIRAESARGNHLIGKNFDTAGPLGPYLVTADEVPDPQQLTIELRVNGELRQHGSTANMIHDVRTLVAHWSQMTLYPGDLVTTGTPSGVAAGRRDDSWFLRPGDVVEITVEPLGTLRNTVRSA